MHRESNFDSFAEWDLNLMNLIDDFPSDLSSMSGEFVLPSLSNIGSGFEPRDLVDLLEVESHLLDDVQSWMYDTAPDAIEQTFMGSHFDVTPSPTPNIVTKSISPTTTVNWSPRICLDNMCCPSLSRPAATPFVFATGTEFNVKPERNMIFFSNLSLKDEPHMVKVSGPTTAMTWCDVNRLVFACGSGAGVIGLLHYSIEEECTVAPALYAPTFHTSQIRDMGSNRNLVISCSDGAVVSESILDYLFPQLIYACQFVSNIELLISNAPAKHQWRASLDTEVSSVCFHPRQPEVISVTTDWGSILTMDMRGKNAFVSRLHPRAMGLVDHCWSRDEETCLAYADGVIARVDMRIGSNVTASDPHLVEVDSIESLNDDTVMVFGSGGGTVYDLDRKGTIKPLALFNPGDCAFLGHGGCMATGSLMISTAANGSIFRFDNVA
jgi:hypothetical protein